MSDPVPLPTQSLCHPAQAVFVDPAGVGGADTTMADATRPDHARRAPLTLARGQAEHGSSCMKSGETSGSENNYRFMGYVHDNSLAGITNDRMADC